MLHQKQIRRRPHPLTRQLLTFRVKHSPIPRLRPRNQFARRPDRPLRHLLRRPQLLDLLPGLHPPLHHPHLQITLHSNPSLPEHLRKTQGQGPVRHDLHNPFSPQTFRRRLRRPHLPVRRKPARRLKIRRNSDHIRPHRLPRPVQFHIPAQYKPSSPRTIPGTPPDLPPTTQSSKTKPHYAAAPPPKLSRSFVPSSFPSNQ